MSPTMNSPTRNAIFARRSLLAVVLAFAAAACLSLAPAAAAPAKTAPAARPAAKGKAASDAPAAGATSSTTSGIETEARNAYIIDFRTGAVLLDKNADERIPPASMSKMMFYYTVFSYLKDGKAKLDDMLPVSEKAWRTQGSKMFVPLGGKVKIEDLLRGVIIQSGNDACIVLAEGLAGSEQAFVDVMNKKAQEIGLTGSHFANVTGLPDPDHYMTARDLATLAKHIITDYPEFYKFESEREFTYNGIRQGNRNPLLYKDLGADGLKTGHTEEAGYCLTASAVRDNRRIIMVLAGMPTMKSRGTESERLIEWAFREFGGYTLYKPGDTVDDADVWLGAETKVPLTVTSDAVVTIPRRSRKDMKVTAVYDKPIKAPITQGQNVGKLVVTVPGQTPTEFPLVAAASVERLGAVGRVGAALSYLVFGAKR
jgi:serine-type D-Ala-D-Ala carboxypeptidase (penicillin-binding protein 5/6)